MFHLCNFMLHTHTLSAIIIVETLFSVFCFLFSEGWKIIVAQGHSTALPTTHRSSLMKLFNFFFNSHTRLLQSEVLLQFNTIYSHIRATRAALQHSTVNIQLMGNVQSSNTYLFQTFSALTVNKLHLFPSQRIKCNLIKSVQSLLIVPFFTSLNTMRDISQYELKKKVARNIFEIIKVIHDRQLLADY